MFKRLTQQEVIDNWHNIKDAIKPSLDLNGGRFLMSDILKGLLSGNMDCFASSRGHYSITMFNYYPAKKTFVILLVGGKNFLKYVDEFYPVFEEYAKKHCCSSMEVLGRSGWVKSLGHLGFIQSDVLVEREI